MINADVTDAAIGDFMIKGASTPLILSNQTLTVHGDWTNAASFSATTNGIVAFAGAGTSVLYGNTAFGGLTCVAPGKPAARLRREKTLG